MHQRKILDSSAKIEAKILPESCAFSIQTKVCCHTAATYVRSPGRVGMRRQGALAYMYRLAFCERASLT